MTPQRYLLLSIAVLCLHTGFAHAQRMVIFVRHAEKETTGDNPVLSAAGIKRAQELARVLKDAGVEAIYTTPFRRTKDTAAPLAAQLQLELKTMPANETPAQLKQRLAANHANQCVLIVGHTNTLPGFIDAMTAAANNIVINESQYDGIYVLTAKPQDKWSLIRAKY